MPSHSKKAFAVASGLLLLALNVAVVAFFVLWQIADTAALNRMEANSDLSSTELLPHANLMWVAAHAAVLLLVALDAVAVLFASLTTRKPKALDAADACDQATSLRSYNPEQTPPTASST
ncbi:hypothetical protein [Microbacterium sp.]|uniref:hypothetical protein n=1 Tax=Microbacterium sp. TaxID=51671 RepID=UPI0039E4BFAC